MPSFKMFPRSFASKDRAGKATKSSRRSFRDAAKQQMLDKLDNPVSNSAGTSPILTSAIITLVVGQHQRLFAAHEDVLGHSPYFAACCRQNQFFDAATADASSASVGRHIILPDEDPEVFSCILEYLYKGDYQPRLLHDKRRNTWMLESKTEDHVLNSPRTPSDGQQQNINQGGGANATLYHTGVGEHILRDTAVYCSADKYGLDELKRIALRKQGLQSGIDVGTILRSARYAYAHTPDSDSRLRAHYLALIIRSRRKFKRSGTMQDEMEKGGKLFFDLFVAMCNHMDDIVELGNSRSPRTI